MEKYPVDVFTGVRPSHTLTIANYIGAIKPIIDLQKKGARPVVFVADLHALTDNEPKQVGQYIQEIAADYIALGLDPEKTSIFTQSAIREEVLTLTAYLARLISVAELLRVPTLKDKLKSGARPETANALLFLYPVLMAADILIQRAQRVPVGEDQLAHLEVSRELARRFNQKYKTVFPLPQPYVTKALRIMSLDGKGKMSKSNPDGAFLLTDTPAHIRAKIKKAATATEGNITDVLKSHCSIIEHIGTEKENELMGAIIKKHKKGEKVMGEFKTLLGDCVERFLVGFQEKRAQVLGNKNFIPLVLEKGNGFARENASRTLELVEKAMKER